MNRIVSIIMVVATVIAVGAAAITIYGGYGSVYAESANRGGGFNDGSFHNRCTAGAAGADCFPHNDNGKHTGLIN